MRPRHVRATPPWHVAADAITKPSCHLRSGGARWKLRALQQYTRNILPDVRGHRVKDKDSEKSESVVVLGLEIAPARRGAALGLCLQHRQGRSPPGRPPILTAKWPCQVLPPAKSGELSGMLRRDSHLRVTKVVSLRREAGHIVCEPQGSHS